MHAITNHYAAQETQKQLKLLRLKIETILWPGYEIEVTNDRDPKTDDIISSFYIKRLAEQWKKVLHDTTE